MSHIFISYSRQDETFARRLATDLSTLGADIWIDVDDIPAGMKWSTAIQQGLKSCEVLIVIISPDSMASRNVEDEWQYYLDDGKPVIPVLLHPADVHFQLRRIQYIDFHAQEYTIALRQLREELARAGIRLDPLPVNMAGATQPPSTQGPLHPPYGAPVTASTPTSIPVKVVAGGVTVAIVAVLLVLALLVGLPALTGDGDNDTPIAEAVTATATVAVPATATTTAPPSATSTVAATATPTVGAAPAPSPTPVSDDSFAFPDFFLVNPVDREFVVTSPFNEPRDYLFVPTKEQANEGMSLMATDSDGNPATVFAAQNGTVTFTGYSETGYGNYIKIEHLWGDDTYVTWYGHLSRIDVEIGQFVVAGEPIGVAGSTGFSSGVNLKIALQHIGAGLDNYVIDDVVDPLPYFDEGRAQEFDYAMFVSDITIPDGTVVGCDASLVKGWQIRNAGYRTWTPEDYQLVFVSGDPMGAPAAITVFDEEIVPGQLTEIWVEFTAPGTTGTYRSTWRLVNLDGQVIAYDLFLVIEVPEDCSQN